MENSNGNFPSIYITTTLFQFSWFCQKLCQKQLVQYLENNALLSNLESGYKKHNSTDLAPTLLVDEIRKNVYNSNLLLFVDLSKPSVFGHFKFLAELLSKTVKKMV